MDFIPRDGRVHRRQGPRSSFPHDTFPQLGQHQPQGDSLNGLLYRGPYSEYGQSICVHYSTARLSFPRIPVIATIYLAACLSIALCAPNITPVFGHTIINLVPYGRVGRC